MVINNGIGNNGDLFVWGRGDYQDSIVGGVHFIEWCYRIMLTFENGKFSVTFIQHGPHNRTKVRSLLEKIIAFILRRKRAGRLQIQSTNSTD